jgi:hypothetical protein
MLATLVPLVAGCPSGLPNGDLVCTEVFVYGLTVDVSDASSAAVQGATLTLTEGNYTATLEEISPGTFIGAGERGGLYNLTVEAAGFESRTITNIFVDEDECHVIPESLDVVLDRI